MLTALGQQREVFTDLNPGCMCRDRNELPPNFGRGMWLEIETLLLSQPTREEDKDTASMTGLSTGRCLQVIHPEPQQPERARLDRHTPRKLRMMGSRVIGVRHLNPSLVALVTG